VSAFARPRQHHSVVVLNKGPATKSVQVDGLDPARRYVVVDWNNDGNGLLRRPQPAVPVGAGTATVDVPSHGLTALSTKPLPLTG
jgi:hypothetical protein